MCGIRARSDFGDRVQHKGEGTRYREKGKEGARRGDKVQHRGGQFIYDLHMK